MPEGAFDQGRECLSQIVEAIGLGHAQYRVLIGGAAGVFFSLGAWITLVNILTESWESYFGIADDSFTTAFAATLFTLGLMGGTLGSGLVGDRFGRKFAIVCSYVVVASCGTACAFSPTFLTVIICCGLIGWGCGLGLAPAMAMLSEMTPVRWRIVMLAPAKGAFALGGLLTSFMAAMDSPDLSDVYWRRIMLVLVGCSLGFLVFLLSFVSESPLFLSSVGRHAAAKRNFKRISKINSREHIDVDYQIAGADDKQTTPLFHQIAVVVSGRYLVATMGVSFAAFCLNLAFSGDMYAAPQVFAKASSLPAAWQVCVSKLIGILCAVVAGTVAYLLERRAAIMTALLMATSVFCCFAISGVYPVPRPFLLEVMFQYGSNGCQMVAQLGFLTINQYSVELYPTSCSSTGSAVILGLGQVAAIIAPMSFEVVVMLTGTWMAFYYFLAALCALGAAVVWGLPPQVAVGAPQGKHDWVGPHSKGYGSTLSTGAGDSTPKEA